MNASIALLTYFCTDKRKHETALTGILHYFVKHPSMKDQNSNEYNER